MTLYPSREDMIAIDHNGRCVVLLANCLYFRSILAASRVVMLLHHDFQPAWRLRIGSARGRLKHGLASEISISGFRSPAVGAQGRRSRAHRSSTGPILSKLRAAADWSLHRRESLTAVISAAWPRPHHQSVSSVQIKRHQWRETAFFWQSAKDADHGRLPAFRTRAPPRHKDLHNDCRAMPAYRAYTHSSMRRRAGQVPASDRSS